jgi:hypothetical protein
MLCDALRWVNKTEVNDGWAYSEIYWRRFGRFGSKETKTKRKQTEKTEDILCLSLAKNPDETWRT